MTLRKLTASTVAAFLRHSSCCSHSIKLLVRALRSRRLGKGCSSFREFGEAFEIEGRGREELAVTAKGTSGTEGASASLGVSSMGRRDLRILVYSVHSLWAIHYLLIGKA